MPSEDPRPDALDVLVLNRMEEPIPHATVRASAETGEFEAETDASGKARIDGLRGAAATVTVDAEGYAGEEAKDLRTDAGPESPLRFFLHVGVPLDGVVVESEGGRPVPDVAVVAITPVFGFVISGGEMWPKPQVHARAQTDRDGRFHLRGVPANGVIDIDAVADGWWSESARVRSPSDPRSRADVVVRLHRAGRLTGRVLNPDSRIVAGASVTSEWLGPAASWPGTFEGRAACGTSDELGNFVIDGVPLDVEWTLAAEAEGFGRSEGIRRPISAGGSAEISVDLTVRATASLTVSLVRDDGSPAQESASVSIWNGHGGSPREAPDAPPNVHRFVGIDPGDYTVEVRRGRLRPVRATSAVAPGASVEIEVPLASEATVSGVVVDPAGAPVAGAQVCKGEGLSCWWPFGDDDERDSCFTDDDGRFELTRLPPGDISICARAGPEGSPSATCTLTARRVSAPARGVRLALSRTGSASLRLLMPDGRPYEGDAYRMCGGMVLGFSGTGEKVGKGGKIVVSGFSDGESDMEVEVKGFAPVRRPFRARPGECVPLEDAVLDPGRNVLLRIESPERTPVIGATARCGLLTDYRRTSDGSGLIRLDHVPLGAVDIDIQAGGFADQAVSIAPRQASEPVPVRLVRGGTVSGSFEEAEAASAPWSRVVVTPVAARGEPPAIGSSLYPNAPFELRLAPGTWRFVAEDEWGEKTVLSEFVLAEGESREIRLAAGPR